VKKVKIDPTTFDGAAFALAEGLTIHEFFATVESDGSTTLHVPDRVDITKPFPVVAPLPPKPDAAIAAVKAGTATAADKDAVLKHLAERIG